MRRPRDVIGGAFSQAPDSFVEAAKSLALSLGPLVASRRPSRVAWTRGWSQDLWWMFPGETGGWWLWPTFHSCRASSAAGWEVPCSLGGSICSARLTQLAAETRKVDGTSSVVLRTPIPSNPMGRVAWVHAKSSTRSILKMALRQERTLTETRAEL